MIKIEICFGENLLILSIKLPNLISFVPKPMVLPASSKVLCGLLRQQEWAIFEKMVEGIK